MEGKNIIHSQEHQFGEVVDIILQHRSRASKAVNEEMLLTAWSVGAYVSRKLKSEEWGSKVVTQLSEYIRSHRPDLKGYSRSSIYNMLCSEGYLVSDGIGRGTTYHLNKDNNLNSSDGNLNSSDGNLNSSDGNLNSSNDDNLKTNTQKTIKKKYSQKELFGIIQNSTQTWKSVEEIALEIGRSTQYLKGEIIPVMVNKGLLEREHAMPNHPAQRYKRKF